ncbi:MAG: 4Fe-4S single cluster domain-containing protein [Anaerolineaceae bacterium]|nr:4Fe-4S single cluster domain-containing protein [Anaerolineaceae bacterium]
MQLLQQNNIYVTGQFTINYAHYHCGTHALGPGYRSVLWVQGCPRNCAGCISKKWAEEKVANEASPHELAHLLLQDPQITGITISGGEPLLQAKQLIELVCECRKRKDVDFICYTGFTFEEIVSDHAHPERAQLLQSLDVLIDGPYQEELDDDRGLRGSSNQRVVFLTNRLVGYDFEANSRKVEISKDGAEDLLMVGLPSKSINKFLAKRLRDFQ